MKRQTLNQHRQSNPADLTAAVNKLKGQLAEFNLNLALGQQKNLSLGSRLRDDLARLKTLSREKAL